MQNLFSTDEEINTKVVPKIQNFCEHQFFPNKTFNAPKKSV